MNIGTCIKKAVTSMTDITIDVVIPVLNGRQWISEALDSVRYQKLKPRKIIVVDDGSTDGTVEYMNTFPDISFFNNPGKGVASARNYGLEQTNAEFVAFLDSDDVWHENHLYNLCIILKKNTEIAIAGSYYHSFQHNVEQPKFTIDDKRCVLVNPWKIFPSLKVICNPSALVFRRSALRYTNWAIEHEGIEDYSMVMKVCKEKGFIRSFFKTVAYRKHKDSFCLKARKDSLAHLQLWERVARDISKTLPESFLSRDVLEKRITIIKKMYCLLKTLIDLKNDSEVSQGLLDFDMSLRSQPNYMRYIMIREMLDFAFPAEAKNTKNSLYHQQIMRITELWPKSKQSVWNSFTEALADEHPGIQFHYRFFMRAPWQINRFKPLFYSLRQKTRTKIKDRIYAESNCYCAYV